ncbi:uncharacterized protein LOC122019309 [Zingiber officinale]|uniref:uncharacterized protein LOC122019309 n=1 Tax=Zingiber officinale TaxID=94328 RepID=UPI001C4DB984|nr:uncharacterized protein LOC122019309 [Zingiber officinale]
MGYFRQELFMSSGSQEKIFKERQEAARKDVERAFGRRAPSILSTHLSLSLSFKAIRRRTQAKRGCSSRGGFLFAAIVEDPLLRRNLNSLFNSIYRPTKRRAERKQSTALCEWFRSFSGDRERKEKHTTSISVLLVKMSKAGPITASIAAASSAAFAAAATPYLFAVIAPSAAVKGESGSLKKASGSRSRRSAEDKFSPRFDGLRFIETLVTAHR